MPATDSAVASDWLDQTALIPADCEKNDQNMNNYHIMIANTSIPVMEEGRYNQAGLIDYGISHGTQSGGAIAT